MKKLMMALAVVACAAAVQASTYNWKMNKGMVYEAGSTTAKAADSTAYLFNASAYSQTDLIKALFVDKTLTIENIGTKAISGANSTVASTGVISTSSDFTYNDVAAGSTWKAYYVVVDGDNVFVSSSTTADIAASAQPSAVAITAWESPTAASKLAAMDGSKGYSSMGWYTAAPEPTSGLLLLIGMAGLALRRRRA